MQRRMVIVDGLYMLDFNDPLPLLFLLLLMMII